jgi:hypothetical protein
VDADVHATAGRKAGATVSYTVGQRRRWATNEKLQCGQARNESARTFYGAI